VAESEKSAEAVVADAEAERERSRRLGRLWRRKGPNGRESEAIMHLGGAMPQKIQQLELPYTSRGEAPRGMRSEEAPTAGHGDERSGASGLMEAVCEPRNLKAALRRVRQNKGSPGIDGMTVEELPTHLQKHWAEIRAALLAGSYRPQGIRRQEIPKSGGGVRELGIPTVLDRFIQQAMSQVLQPIFDPTFSEHSHGFRPKRSAHGAVCEAQRYVQAGRPWVVDIDLEKFFDRVNHDVLMGRLAKRIGDKRMLGLIRRYLEAGVMVNGVVMERDEGDAAGRALVAVAGQCAPR
jgi:RNA-directed DNA polymerase